MPELKATPEVVRDLYWALEDLLGTFSALDHDGNYATSAGPVDIFRCVNALSRARGDEREVER